MTTDAVLTDNDFDFQIDTNGDILTDDFFDTAFLVSLFAEQRATASEVPESHRRRGWIGNEATPGFEIGSKLWLYEQARATRTNLAGIETAALNALQWMIDDAIAISVSATATLSDGSIALEVIIKRPSSKVEKRYFELWDNTGNF